MSRWVVKDDDEGSELAIIEASALTRTVTVHIPTPDPVAMTPERADQFRNALGLAAGVARGDAGLTDV